MRGSPQRRARGPLAKREPTTEELRQPERATEEHQAVDASATRDEAHQHQRRANKSAYLERMLAKRERSERGDENTD